MILPIAYSSNRYERSLLNPINRNVSNGSSRKTTVVTGDVAKIVLGLALVAAVALIAGGQPCAMVAAVSIW